MKGNTVGAHDKCFSTAERYGWTLICGRSKGHVDHDNPMRAMHFDVNNDRYWFDRLTWEQIEPRRRYRTTIEGRAYVLVRQGRGAVGAGLDVGWYLEDGLDGKGHEFMESRRDDAMREAAFRIAQHLGTTGLSGGSSR